MQCAKAGFSGCSFSQLLTDPGCLATCMNLRGALHPQCMLQAHPQTQQTGQAPPIPMPLRSFHGFLYHLERRGSGTRMSKDTGFKCCNCGRFLICTSKDRWCRRDRLRLAGRCDKEDQAANWCSIRPNQAGYSPTCFAIENTGAAQLASSLHAWGAWGIDIECERWPW